ncbi:hypothetical protein EHP00_508 [Ecytonucleospora hepatopenaei]|uniref:Uncharacterized protein n=1 Tax=Ecytonucleospora hepatopenaei TaxID=646526 RepID=A0A1W0E447_9MICR|nr:hypothetical protein EHP00_508 [Ecytonucleospora hepatopenaei]
MGVFLYFINLFCSEVKAGCTLFNIQSNVPLKLTNLEFFKLSEQMFEKKDFNRVKSSFKYFIISYKVSKSSNCNKQGFYNIFAKFKLMNAENYCKSIQLWQKELKKFITTKVTSINFRLDKQISVKEFVENSSKEHWFLKKAEKHRQTYQKIF